MRKDRPIPFSLDFDDDKEGLQGNKALYTIMKKMNLKIRQYAKDNMSVPDASRLFDLTPLIEQVRDCPQFVLKEDDPRNMAPALGMLFRFINNLFSEFNYYGIVHIKDDYDRYLHYRITLNKINRILIVNDTGESYDSNSPFSR